MLQGNFIGTDVTGTKPLGNAVDGLNLRFGPGGNTILVNVISANKRAGIVVESSESNNVVQGNFIGTDVTGTLTLGNADRGIVITDANHTTIQGNIIAHNALDGIGVRDNVSTSNQLLGNSIFGNAGLGIDLLLDGVTPNDDGDTDDGPNHLQNFPVLQSVTNGGGMTTITGRLNSAASTTYRIEFFANDSIDSSGYGEGQIFLGFKNATTNGSGNITFSQASRRSVPRSG
jgi:parallel beta-helix repeat protein